MAKVLIFCADGFEEIEMVTVLDILRRGGMDVQTVALGVQTMVKGAHGLVIRTDTRLEEIENDVVDLIVLPGGMPGTDHLREEKRLKKMVRRHHQQGGRLAAICAAPSALGEWGLLKDKQITCYPGFENQCLGAKVSEQSIVVDEWLTTAKGAGVSADFAYCLLEQLAGKEMVNRLKMSMFFGLSNKNES